MKQSFTNSSTRINFIIPVVSIVRSPNQLGEKKKDEEEEAYFD